MPDLFIASIQQGRDGGGRGSSSRERPTGHWFDQFFPFPPSFISFYSDSDIFHDDYSRQDFSKFLLRVYVIVEFIKKEKEKRSNEKPMFDRAGGHNLLEKMMDAERKQEFVLK